MNSAPDRWTDGRNPPPAARRSFLLQHVLFLFVVGPAVLYVPVTCCGRELVQSCVGFQCTYVRTLLCGLFFCCWVINRKDWREWTARRAAGAGAAGQADCFWRARALWLPTYLPADATAAGRRRGPSAPEPRTTTRRQPGMHAGAQCSNIDAMRMRLVRARLPGCSPPRGGRSPSHAR